MQLNFSDTQPSRAKPQVFKLRPYQVAGANAANRKFAEGARSLLIVYATGGGKTPTLAHMCRQRAARGLRSIVMAHRDELIRQAADKIESICGFAPGIEKAQEHSRGDEPVVVSSIQTMISRDKLPGDPFDFGVVDEVHHATRDNTYGKVLDRLQLRQLLGVTATPGRTDQAKLSDIFEDTAYVADLMYLINNGWLVDINVKTLPVQVDLSKVNISRSGEDKGDFKRGELGCALEPYLEPIADIVARDYRHKKLLAFFPLVDNSKTWAKLLRERGIPSAHVDGGGGIGSNGEDRGRAEVLSSYSNGKYTHLSNSSLLTEGYDEDSIDVVLNFRATKSKILLSQMIGRGTRPLKGCCDHDALEDRLAAIARSKKPNLLVLDPMFISEKHNILSIADIHAEDDAHVGEIKKRMSAGRSLQEATEDERLARREALAEKLRANSHRTGYEKKIAELSLALGVDGLEDYQPVYKWQKEAATVKQIEVLKKTGVDPELASCRGMATAILTGMEKRREEGLATLKQVRFLLRKGVPDADKLTFADASKMMDRISQGWTRKGAGAPVNGVAA